MHNKIDRNKKRFDDILKRKARKDFKGYIFRKEAVIPRGKDRYALPIYGIKIPRFTYGSNSGGVGQGDGDEGQDINKPAEHKPELEVSLEELAEMLCESLELPRLQKKDKNTIPTVSQKHNSISKSPTPLINFKRTYLQALKRTIIEGDYAPEKPPQISRSDLIFKSPKKIELPDTKAAIFYLMDVSGSMTAEKKELVRTTAFWTDTYLRSQYKHLENIYITHDMIAEEITEDLFYNITTDGGTKMSSAIELSDKIIEKRFPPAEWNIYLFQFSDGENLSTEDNEHAETLLKKMLPYINQYAYAEVGDKGSFKDHISDSFGNEPKISLANINNRSQIIETLQQFLGKGN